ncbi:MAG: hydroxysqualene dehydroxylase HpnE [Gammaproteobacteria bacterium]|nr:hydroxysqualene dehydroxylase HpnE [Gammaproteobacteria bacterium]
MADPVHEETVVVVGGGWAGLAAAVELTHAGIPVILIESARQLGGRARCVRFGELRVDNGQHILLGAYREWLGLLQRIGLEERQVVRRLPLELEMMGARDPGLHLHTPALPAPLHLLAGLLSARGLTLRERLAALRFGYRLARSRPSPEQDRSVATLLREHRQPARLIRLLWEPLCLAALNTPIEIASAHLFLQVLRESFRHRRQDSDLLLPVTDLGSALPEPALHYIERHGGQVWLNRRVSGLRLSGTRLEGVELGSEFLPSRQLVLAVNPVMCRRLLSPHAPFTDLVRGLVRLEYQPITTLYLRYPETVRLPRPMLGLLDGPGQWVFDRGLAGQPGLMAVVISAAGAHMAQDNEALGNAVGRQLAELFPHWPVAGERMVIREKRATFASQVGVEALRPGSATPVAGCWLAGDFTATGLPGTLEGAVLSGRACARGILRQQGGKSV